MKARVYRLSKNQRAASASRSVREYLASLNRSFVGNTEIWVRAEGRYVVAVGPTQSSVTPSGVSVRIGNADRSKRSSLNPKSYTWLRNRRELKHAAF